MEFLRTDTLGHPVESLLRGFTAHCIGSMRCFLTLIFVTHYFKHSISTWCISTLYFRLEVNWTNKFVL